MVTLRDRGIDGGPELGGQRVDGGVERRIGHAKRIERDAVECGGQLHEHGIAFDPHTGDDVANHPDRLVAVERRPRKMTSHVGTESTQIEPIEHGVLLSGPADGPTPLTRAATEDRPALVLLTVP